LRFTKLARTPALQRLWAKTANAARIEYGNDASAVRVADAALKRKVKRKLRKI
jgi:hypothetical protein